MQTGPDFVPLGEATNVWGIGRIAWTLVVNRCDAYGPVRDQKDKEATAYLDIVPLSINHAWNKVKNNHLTTLTGGKYNPAAAEYDSDELKNIVQACLNYDPKDRPTLDDIYGAAAKWLSTENLAVDQIMDQGGLELRFPSNAEFEIGRAFDLAKHRLPE
jgi:serine/threonine protein kinase